MEEGVLKGEQCNRDGCTGIIDEREKDGCCSCHIHPPCGYCTLDTSFCPVCGYDGEDEQREAESVMLSTPVKPWTRAPRIEPVDDGKKYKINQYFDDVFECVVASGLTLPEADTKMDKLRSQPHYYVSWRMEVES